MNRERNLNDSTKIRNESMQEFALDHSYRIYLTMDQWIVTKDDHDIIRIQRRADLWSDGYLLLMIELLYMQLHGKRTELRERWALYSEQYVADAQKMHAAMLENPQKVDEVIFEPTRSRLVRK